MPNLLQNILLIYSYQNIMVMFFIMLLILNHKPHKHELFFYLN